MPVLHAVRWRGAAICSKFTSYCGLSSCSLGLGLFTVHVSEEEEVDSEQKAFAISEVSYSFLLLFLPISV